jgi:hypothetical protein
MVGRIEPVDGVLLLVLDATEGGQLALQIGIVTRAREGVGEDAGFHLDAVHQDDAAPCKSVNVLLAVWRQHHLLPRPHLPLQRNTTLVERIHRHRALLPFSSRVGV